jgi:hypothetical protein
MLNGAICGLFGLLAGWVLWGPKPHGFWTSSNPTWAEPQQREPDDAREFGGSWPGPLKEEPTPVIPGRREVAGLGRDLEEWEVEGDGRQ